MVFTDENKQVVRQFFEAADRKDIDRMAELVSPPPNAFHFGGMPPMDWDAHK